MATPTKHQTSSDQFGVKRVTRDPRILSSEPIVGASRTTVAAIVLAARDGSGVDGILYDFPHLTVQDVADALAFYVQHQAEIDAIIAAYASD